MKQNYNSNYSFIQTNLRANSNFNTNQSFIKTLNKSTLNKNLYHSTETIFNNLRALQTKGCKNKLIEEDFTDSEIKNIYENKNNNDLSKYDGIYSIFKLSNFESTNKNKLKIFIIAGEHARELISVEIIYYFVNILCSGNQLANYFLDNMEFQIVPVGNPLGRKEVESGHYCKRSNLNRVDPNRNWNYNWIKNNVKYATDEYSGDFPYSEVESFFVKQNLDKFKPDVFLTLHSGVFGLFTPYGSKKEFGTMNKENMIKVLSQVKSLFCPMCSVSTPSIYLDYISNGNCLDYAYDILKTPYTFAWEAYTNEIDYKPFINAFKAGLSNNLGKDMDNLSKFGTQSNSFLEINGTLKSENVSIDNDDNFGDKNNTFSNEIDDSDSNSSYKINSHDIKCLYLFNPNTEKEYSDMINIWTKSLLYTFKTIYKWEKEKDKNK